MSDARNTGLTVWQNRVRALRPESRRLAKQRRRMEYIAEVARTAMNQLSENYAYSQFKAHMALTVTAKLRKDIAAGRISPQEEAAYQQETEEYLRRMLEVAELSGAQILEEQKRIRDTMGNGNLVEDAIDFLLGH